MSGPPVSQWGTPGRGPGESAMSAGRLVLAFAAALIIILAIAAVAIFVFAPQPLPPSCDPGQPCGGPPGTLPPVTSEATPAPTATPGPIPTPPPTQRPTPTPAATPAPTSGLALPQPMNEDSNSPTLEIWPIYTDPTYGYGIHYPPYLTPQELDGGGVLFDAAIDQFSVEVVVRVDGADASTTPQELQQTMVDAFRGNISSLTKDDSAATRVHDPSIGEIPAIVTSYRGDLGDAGSVTPVALVVMAATDGQHTVAVTVLIIDPDTTIPDSGTWFRVSGEVVDPILKRFEWAPGT